MGWFDEQIRARISHDDEVFQDAMAGMAGIVMGRKMAQAMQDDRIQTRNAIEEMLKFYHVKPIPLPDEITDINDAIEYLMRPAGIMRRTVALRGKWYTEAIGAMLGVLKEDAAIVALIPGKLGGYTYRDPKTGKTVRLTKQTAALLEEEALCFYKPLPLKKIGIPDLLLYMAQTLEPIDFVFVAVATLAVTLVGKLMPWLSRLIYGSVVTSSSVQLLVAVFTFYLSVQIATMLLNTARGLLQSRLTTKMVIPVRAASMMRMLSLPAPFFKNYSSGDLSTRMSYIDGLCLMLSDIILSTGLSSVFSLMYISDMLRYAPGVVVPGLMVIAVTVAYSVISMLAYTEHSKRTMELSAGESGVDYALVSGVQKIRLAGAEKRAFAKWASTYTRSAALQYDPPFLIKFGTVVSQCISLIGTMVLYFFTIKTQVSMADYFAFNSAYGMVMGAFTSLVGIVGSIAQVRSMLNMVRPILETVPEVSENKKVVTRLSGGIELNNVSFRYQENMPLIVDDMSLKIRPGQYVAIVGKTGCGKSTLVRLLLGFEKPQKGAIYFDGQDIETLDLKSLRRRIGTVMQNGKLFQGDLYSNITVSAPWLSVDDAWAAAELAGIADDIRDMPMGMKTVLSEGGGGVSGGQRQRLMIARAVAGKPRILIFDEATSALDNITQKQVSDALDGLKCTRIVIAHRLSTIRHCDRILVLDKGKIIEDGTYEELIALNGFFAELVARQRIDAPAVSEA